jgi:hypothetical protein
VGGGRATFDGKSRRCRAFGGRYLHHVLVVNQTCGSFLAHSPAPTHPRLDERGTVVCRRHPYSSDAVFDFRSTQHGAMTMRMPSYKVILPRRLSYLQCDFFSPEMSTETTADSHPTGHRRPLPCCARDSWMEDHSTTVLQFVIRLCLSDLVGPYVHSLLTPLPLDSRPSSIQLVSP